jgi:MFS family permease
MLDTYRTVLNRPGTLAFSSAGVVARLPISMVGLGLVLLVSSTTGSYALAGAVAAAFTLTSALTSIFQGRLLDRFGQARILVPATWLFTAALVTVAVSVQLDWPRATTYLTAALAGATLPAVGACVRARWSYVLSDPREVQTAYALEAVLDESVFMVGPILVTLLATAWHPLAGLGSAVLAAFVGTLALAAQRRTEPPTSDPDDPGAPRPAMPWRALVPVSLICLGLGVLFGAAEVSTVAFSEERGATQYSGPLLALWAAGSLIAGIVTGAIRWQAPPASRLRWGAAAMAVAMAPLSLVGSFAVLGVILFVGGFAIAPTLIATTSVVEQTVPRGRLVEGMALIHTCIAGGVAPGAALAGVLVDRGGASTAYLVPLAAGLVAAVAAQATPRAGRAVAPVKGAPES